MKVRVSFIVVFLFSTISIFAQLPYRTNSHVNEPNSEPREHPIDVQRMTLKVKFEPEKGLVKGIVTHVFKPLRKTVDSIFFDAIKMKISEATVNGKPARYSVTDAGITVYPQQMKWGSTDSISFVYEASPRSGLYFIGWNDTTNRCRKQIWSQGQGIDSRAWVPMYDEMNDKYITETIVTFDKNYHVLSNGTKLNEQSNSDGTKTWHYRMMHPHAPYLLTLVIGKYAVETRKSSSGIVNNLYYYPEYKNRVEPTYLYSTESMDFLESFIGIPYPWELYSQIMVQDFTFGAMENTTATTFGDFSFVDPRGFKDRSYIGTNVHELTHQWFGDFITARVQKHVWLQESFATFYPKYFFKKYAGTITPESQKNFGEDAYEWNLRGEHNSALNASEKDRLPIVHPSSGSARIYPKGSAVIDMMMYVFGEEEIRKVIKHYLEHHNYANVETNDLYLAFQDTLGITPDWFFDQWLYRGGEPHYKVEYEDIRNANGRATVVHVDQIHTMDELTGPFKMPIEFDVYYKDGTKDSKTDWISSIRHNILIPNSSNKEIAFVLFDPGSRILKKTTFKKTFDELKYQVINAPHMIDRYDALIALKDMNNDGKELLLQQVFEKEQFYAIKNEIIVQMHELGTPNALNLIANALKDKSEDVRKAALNGLKTIPLELKSSVEQLLTDESYAIITIALEKLCDQFPSSADSYLEKTSNEAGLYDQISIKSLEIKAGKGDLKALEKLIDFTSNAFESWTRRNAMNSLKRINYLNESLILHLLDAAWNPNSRLSSSAIEVLQYFYQQSQYKQLILQAKKSNNDSKSWQKDAWAKIIR
jgi:aminopeptidase N